MTDPCHLCREMQTRLDYAKTYNLTYVQATLERNLMKHKLNTVHNADYYTKQEAWLKETEPV